MTRKKKWKKKKSEREEKVRVGQFKKKRSEEEEKRKRKEIRRVALSRYGMGIPLRVWYGWYWIRYWIHPVTLRQLRATAGSLQSNGPMVESSTRL